MLYNIYIYSYHIRYHSLFIKTHYICSKVISNP